MEQGPFDAAFFNSVFGNVFDQREALLRTCLLLKPGDSPGFCSPRLTLDISCVSPFLDSF